jgi:hypothetical protein
MERLKPASQVKGGFPEPTPRSSATLSIFKRGWDTGCSTHLGSTLGRFWPLEFAGARLHSLVFAKS